MWRYMSDSFLSHLEYRLQDPACQCILLIGTLDETEGTEDSLRLGSVTSPAEKVSGGSEAPRQESAGF